MGAFRGSSDRFYSYRVFKRIFGKEKANQIHNKTVGFFALTKAQLTNQK